MKTKLFIPVAFIAAFAILAGCGTEPTACFTMTSESIDNDDDPLVGEEIEFENCSSDATSYEWDFGDDATSTKENPKHTYDAPGEYTVTLTATGDGGTNSTSQDITVQATVTGSWTGSMTVDTEIYPIEFELEQNGTELTGSFQFGDGSGYSTLSSGSKIVGQDVTIKFTETTYGMVFNFTGDVNDDFDEMGGNYTVTMGTSYLNGTWDIEKTGKKTTIRMTGKGLESLIKKF